MKAKLPESTPDYWWLKNPRPTVVFDFDGVINSYKSGWCGVDNMPDPPVPGIREAITHTRAAGYTVVVISTRCSTPQGLEAVKVWLDENRITVDDVRADKPPAVCYIDDRAICFDGDAGSLIEKIVNFRPWHSTEKEVAK